MTPIPPPITHHFRVQFTYQEPTRNPSFPGTTYTATGFVGVIANTIDEAIAAVRAQVPDAVIYTVSHQGKIHLKG